MVTIRQYDPMIDGFELTDKEIKVFKKSHGMYLIYPHRFAFSTTLTKDYREKVLINENL